jgi:hypothetical protein
MFGRERKETQCCTTTAIMAARTPTTVAPTPIGGGAALHIGSTGDTQGVMVFRAKHLVEKKKEKKRQRGRQTNECVNE